MKKYFFTGLATLLPAAVTFWIVLIIVNFLTKPFMGLMIALISKTELAGSLSEKGMRNLSQILILVFLFFLTLFLGFVARRLFFNQIIQLGDRLLKKIPLVNKVYKTSKEIVQSLFVSDKSSFKQVVILPFPDRDCYCVGIITSDSPDYCSRLANESLVSVFIPTTPNPTTGFLVMIPKEKLIFLEMKSEDAIKYIVSCAVIQPAYPGGKQ